MSLHSHLSALPREEQLEFIAGLTAKQRSELAAYISIMPKSQREKGSVHSKMPKDPRDVRVEESCWGDVLRYSEVLDKLAQRRKAPVYTMSRTTRFPPVRSSSAAALLGPGHYPLDCDFPLDSDELQAGRVTRTYRILGYGFDREERVADDGALKGNSTTAGNKVPHTLAPGSYNIIDVRHYKLGQVSPKFSIARDGAVKRPTLL